MNIPMTSMQRVMTTLGHHEPDRVPVFLSLSMHGAKELGMSIQDYFSKAENVVQGQILLQAKYDNDLLNPFFYGPIEVEAWGGEVIFAQNGPPNSGEPLIKDRDQIWNLHPPRIDDCPCLLRVLETIQGLKAYAGESMPIVGVAISPFSLPVMQLGFDSYLRVLHEHPDHFWRLMQVNEAFCVAWANAQLQAGATAVCYFDPVSSPTIIPVEMYVQTGLPIAKRTLSRIQGPTATHLASGQSIPILGHLAQTGTAAVGVSAFEDLTRIKSLCGTDLSIIGNLNGIAMRHWTQDETEQAVKQALAQAAAGGGFILSDNHGEIPYQVPDDVLLAVVEAVKTWGEYPLK